MRGSGFGSFLRQTAADSFYHGSNHTCNDADGEDRSNFSYQICAEDRYKKDKDPNQ